MIDAMNAINKLKENYKKDTVDAEYWSCYSRASYTLYRYDDAKTSINKAIHLNPQARYYFEKGLLYGNLKNLDTALKAMDIAIKMEDNGQYYHWRGLLNQGLKNMQAAEKDYRAALERKIETADLENNFAIILYHYKKFEECLIHTNKAISLDKNYAQAYSIRAKLYISLLNIDSACIDNATSYRLGNKEIYNIPDSICKGPFNQKIEFAADVCVASKWFKQAIEGYSKLIENNFLKSAYFFNRGYCYYQLMDYSNAEADYMHALRLPRPYFDMIYSNLSLLYFDQKKYAKAIEFTTKRIELNPANSNAYLDRGVGYRKMKAYKESENDYNKAISIKPDFAKAYAYKAFLFLEQKQFDKALQAASKAVEIDPQYGYAYLVRGQVKKELGLEDFCIDLYTAKKYKEPGIDDVIKQLC